MNILVTGGAGYIGSHCIKELLRFGYRPIALDNLVNGHQEAISPKVPFYRGDIVDAKLLKTILKKEKITCVMHFAAYCYVRESDKHPLKYYCNNVAASLQLLKTLLENGIRQFVFSSSCATFGTPNTFPITEETPQLPINPYGQTKLDIEKALHTFSKVYAFSFAALRYFNAAGASADGTIGEDHTPETHLIPLTIQVALGQRSHIDLLGTDHNTPDGTCLRDYIHVEDLCRAHIQVIPKLATPKTALCYNLGTEKTYSVREVIQTVERISGKSIKVKHLARHPADPPLLYTSCEKAKRELLWNIQYSDLPSIIETAWRWHKSHPNGFKTCP